jgi:predicted MPP superfamily phosphohydrolase
VGKPISRSKFLKQAGLVGGGIVFGGLTMGMFKWVVDFKIWKENINLKKLPVSFNGFRIVQFSDIHLGSWLSKDQLEVAVRQMNELQPDVIFFTGDLVNYETDEAFEFEDTFKKLRAKQGIFAVLGNHDYGDYKPWDSKQAKQANMIRLYDFYDRLGWKLLNNENHLVSKGSDQIAIIGVENWGSLGRFQKYGDLDKAVRGVENVPVKILLSHDPSHWELKVRDYPFNIDLTLSGHTHGAQFGFEFPGMRWSPSQYIYKHWAGLYSEMNPQTGLEQHLYVNRGIGTIGYPGRVGIYPEITIIQLRS